MENEQMEFDVVIVGAGPAGLAAAIRLTQLAKQQNREISICVLEKGSEVGAHLLSGAILEPTSLNELLPNWQEMQSAPALTPVIQDHFYWLSQTKAFKLPTPGSMQNKGNHIISIGELCRCLAKHAEQEGVAIFPGFPASRFLFDEQKSDRICGVITQDRGRDKQGNPTERYQSGIAIHAKYTLLAEGCHGSLSQQVIARYGLRQGKSPQTYGLGIKEIWEIPATQHEPGKVFHSIGWPLDTETYGGSFIYHADNHQVSVGFVVGLDYPNPYLDPFAELQRFKTHPKIAPLFQGGKRIAYGARALVEGGLQSLPKLTFPGGMLLGDAAGFLNVAKIKGIHPAIQSGMLAAETVFDENQSLDTRFRHSSLYKELHRVRNIRPAFRWGLLPGLAYSAIDYYLFRGHAPWTLAKQHPADHAHTKEAKDYQPIDYPKPDGIVTFDKLSSVYLSNTNHEENQPCHLILKEPKTAIEVNLKRYAAPETRYCPAQVYETVEVNGEKALQINAPNCVHCKTCDIKDPTQNIVWVTPEGGDGPNYERM